MKISCVAGIVKLKSSRMMVVYVAYGIELTNQTVFPSTGEHVSDVREKKRNERNDNVTNCISTLIWTLKVKGTSHIFFSVLRIVDLKSFRLANELPKNKTNKNFCFTYKMDICYVYLYKQIL